MRFLCIDDDAGRMRPLTDMVGRVATEIFGANVSIDVAQPLPFEDEVARVESSLSQGYDGILLDQRLGDVEVDGVTRRYRGTALAQEIRNRCAESGADVLWGVPVVLVSLRTNLVRTYEHDGTAHDLFDVVYTKEEFEEDPDRCARQLISLVHGYRMLRRARTDGSSAIDVLRSPSEVDPRIADPLGFGHPIHDQARFIIRQLLETPGPLVTKQYVQVRLGTNDDRVSEMLPTEARYVGPFADGWPRYWWSVIDAWFRGISDGRAPRLLNVAERVAVLRRFVPDIAPLPDGEARPWATCMLTGVPVEPGVDAVRLNRDVQPWQEPLLRAITAAREASTDAVHPLDRGRLE